MLRLSIASACRARTGCGSAVQHVVRRHAHGTSTPNTPVYAVFGATGGIGSALTQRLAQQGGSRLALISNEDDKLHKLKEQLGKDNEAEVITVDALSEEQVHKALEKVREMYGRLDGVANCVGDVTTKSARATSSKELQRVLDTNLFTTFNIVKASVKEMLRNEDNSSSSGSSGDSSSGQHQGGSIVLVSAAVASHGVPNYAAMSAAKSAVEGLARSAAATYASKNIRVNCVAPGMTATRQTEKFLEKPRVAEASKQMHPQKDIASPADIAPALEFFLRPENAFVTGQVLAVDGGLSSLQPHSAEEYGI